MSESMMCCPLSDGGCDEPATCFSQHTVTAKKVHQCSECGDDIPRGVKYERAKGMWDGSWSTFQTCLSCVEIRDHFACGNGFIYEDVWNQIRENFFPDMKAGGKCMDGLSPAAKARLFELRLEWMFDSDLEIDGAPPPGMKVDYRSGRLVKADDPVPSMYQGGAAKDGSKTVLMNDVDWDGTEL